MLFIAVALTTIAALLVPWFVYGRIMYRSLKHLRGLLIVYHLAFTGVCFILMSLFLTPGGPNDRAFLWSIPIAVNLGACFYLIVSYVLPRRMARTGGFGMERLETMTAVEIEQAARSRWFTGAAKRLAGKGGSPKSLTRRLKYALDADPSNLEARRMLAEAYLESGSTEAARRVVEEGLEENTDDPRLLDMKQRLDSR